MYVEIHPMSNPEHVEWVKRAQKILGALLWLSTRTRPDIACAVSLAAQSQRQDLDQLKIRLRHLLQYLNTTKTFGLLYTFPQKEQPSILCSQSLQIHHLLHLESTHRQDMSSCCHLEVCVTSSTGILPGRRKLLNLQQNQSFMLFAPLSRQQETFDF